MAVKVTGLFDLWSQGKIKANISPLFLKKAWCNRCFSQQKYQERWLKGHDTWVIELTDALKRIKIYSICWSLTVLWARLLLGYSWGHLPSDVTWESPSSKVFLFLNVKHGHWKPHANYHKLIHLQPFASSSSTASQAWHEQISSIRSFLTLFLHTATSYTLENQHGTQKFMVCRSISSYDGDIFRFQPFIFRGYYPSRGWWGHRIVSSHVHQSTFEKLLRYPIMPAPQPR